MCPACLDILKVKKTRTVQCPVCKKLTGVRMVVIEPDDDLTWKGPK